MAKTRPISLTVDADADAAARPSMVQRTVQQLVALSLASEDGAYLGSENDLLQRLEISRPTLRQAAKVAESGRLIAVRRGVNGGFYATRPDAHHVTQMPALWLRLQAVTLEQMNQASQLVIAEAASSAARCCDPGLRAELAAMRERISQRAAEIEPTAIAHRREADLVALIGRMSGNPVLSLFSDIAYAFGLYERDSRVLRTRPSWRSDWFAAQGALCDAILSGDPEVARLMAQRRAAMLIAWIAEDRTAEARDAKAGAIGLASA